MNVLLKTRLDIKFKNNIKINALSKITFSVNIGDKKITLDLRDEDSFYKVENDFVKSIRLCKKIEFNKYYKSEDVTNEKLEIEIKTDNGIIKNPELDLLWLTVENCFCKRFIYYKDKNFC